MLLAHVGPVQHQGRGLLLHGGGQDVGRDLLSGEVNTRPEARVKTDSVPGLTDPDIVTMAKNIRKLNDYIHLAAFASSEDVRSLNTGSITDSSS